MNFLLRTYSWMTLLENTGLVNTLLQAMGLSTVTFLYNANAVLLGMVYNYLPFMILPILTALQKIDHSYFEAAQDLGASPLYALRKVILPEIMPGVITGALMAFTMSIDDFIISYFTSSGVQNLSIYVYSSAKRGIEPTVYALSTLMFVTVLTLLLILNRRSAHERSAAKV